MLPRFSLKAICFSTKVLMRVSETIISTLPVFWQYPNEPERQKQDEENI